MLEVGSGFHTELRLRSMRFEWLIELQTYDVANLMVLLKVVRSKNKPSNTDSWLDMAGYAACGCEVATEEKCQPSD